MRTVIAPSPLVGEGGSKRRHHDMGEGASRRHWVGRYVGIPFAEHGLDFRGCHCWGLVRLVLQHECAIALPDYGEISATELIAAARRIGGESALPPWSRVAGEWRSFDVLLMHARPAGGGRVPGHVGIVSAPKHVLHVERATAAVDVPIAHPSVRHRIIAAFRHEALM